MLSCMGLPSRSAFSRAAFSRRAFLSASICALMAARALASSCFSVEQNVQIESISEDWCTSQWAALPLRLASASLITSLALSSSRMVFMSW